MGYSTAGYNVSKADIVRDVSDGRPLLDVVVEDGRQEQTTYRFAADGTLVKWYANGTWHRGSDDDFRDACEALYGAGFFEKRDYAATVRTYRGTIRSRAEKGGIPGFQQQGKRGSTIDDHVALPARQRFGGEITVLSQETARERSNFCRAALGLPKL